MSQSNRLSSARQADLPAQPDLSVIVVSWNVRDLLIACVEALFSPGVQGKLRLEVIVVDNASTDGSAAALREMPVRLIVNPRNAGYGRANNQGLRAAKGKFLLVLNPDTLPQPASLETLLEFAQTRTQAGIVAPRLLNNDGSVQTAAFRFPTLAMAAIDLFPLPEMAPGRIRRWLALSALNGRYPGEAEADAPFRIDHPLGACLLLRREAYEECGGFDERIFMYSEEVDLALRYRRRGWECWQVPTATVIHLGGQSTRQLPDRMFVELWRSRLYLYRKHYGRASRAALGALLAAATLRDLVGGSLRLLTGPSTEGRRQIDRARAVLRLLTHR